MCPECQQLILQGVSFLDNNFYFGGNILPRGLGITDDKIKGNIKIPKEVQNQKDYKNLKKYFLRKRGEH